MSTFKTITWNDGVVRVLDQRKLPHEIVYNDYRTPSAVAEAIREMVIRGAPAIGAAAAFGLALVPYHTPHSSVADVYREVHDAAEVLRQARPTAVNLSWAIDRILLRLGEANPATVQALRYVVLGEAQSIFDEDIQTNRRLGVNALPLIPDPATIIHHCNTGSLATVDFGTALGVIRTAHQHGKKVFVLVDETRPRLQGARLTAWELQQDGIPFMVIADGASGHYMQTRRVDLCVVGCDRVAANGDTANKIGTYNLAVVAHENGVPFFVAAPTTTIDMRTPTGEQIVIEERDPGEVTHIGDQQITPQGVAVGNPAFDVTPARYITAIITERGVVYPPFEEGLKNIMVV